MRFRIPELSENERKHQARALFADLHFGIPETFYSADDAPERWAARRLFVDASKGLPGYEAEARRARALADDANLAFTAVLEDPEAADQAEPHPSLNRITVGTIRRDIKRWLNGDPPLSAPGVPTRSRAQQAHIGVLHRAGPKSTKRAPENVPPPSPDTIALPATIEVRIDPDCTLITADSVVYEIAAALSTPAAREALQAVIQEHAPYVGQMITDDGVSLSVIPEALSCTVPVADRPPNLTEAAVRGAVFTQFNRRRYIKLEVVAGQWVVTIPNHYGKNLHGRFIARPTNTASAIGNTGVTFDRV